MKREPHAQQVKFINAAAKEQLYGGAKRGGKSVALVMKIILLLFLFPGNRILLARKDFTDLQDTTLKEFWETVPDELLDKRYGNGTGHNKGERCIRLKTIKEGVSSDLLYRGLGGPEDVEKAKGLNLGALFIDEPSEIDFDTYKMLLAQLTWVLSDGSRPPYMACLGSNPEPGWVKERFIENPEPGTVFIPSLPRQNPFLPPGWENELRASFDQEWIDKYLDGSWEVTEGTVFVELSAQVHDISALVETPEFRKLLTLCTFFSALDHGETGITASTVQSLTPWNDQLVLHEYYKKDELIGASCKDICAMFDSYTPPVEGLTWRKHFRWHLIDPSTTKRSLQSGRTKQAIADAYRAGGAGDAKNEEYALPVIPAWNALELGIQHLKQRLHINPLHRHPITGSIGAPHFFIVRKNCPNTWKEMRDYRKKVTPIGKAIFLGSDHGLDTVRYGANALIEPPEVPIDLSHLQNQERFAVKTHARWAKGFDAQARGQNTGSWF